MKYRPGKLNPPNSPSQRPDYKEEDSTLAFKSSFFLIVQEQQPIQRGYPRELALLDFAISEL